MSKLAPKHQALSTYEKEFLAVLMALEKWRGYLLDKHFLIKTDHYSLKYLLDQNITTPGQMKWLPKLIGFDYEVVYKKGTDNAATDALSRRQNVSELFSMSTISISTDLYSIIKTSWTEDEHLQTILASLLKGETRKHYALHNGQLLRKGKLVVGLLQPLLDRLTKYGHFIPMAHPFTALPVAQVFLDNVCKLHGVLESTVSDRDKVFLSTFWKELFKLLHVKLLLSTSYHPQTDGQTEVVNRCLEGYLRCMFGKHPKG
ncbi:retrotransposable element Tf2 [Tanacetum coccineum]